MRPFTVVLSSRYWPEPRKRTMYFRTPWMRAWFIRQLKTSYVVTFKNMKDGKRMDVITDAITIHGKGRR